eukprot:sb/3478081/
MGGLIICVCRVRVCYGNYTNMRRTAPQVLYIASILVRIRGTRGVLHFLKSARITQGLRKVYARITQGLRKDYAKNTQGIRKEYAMVPHRIRKGYAGITQVIRK